MVTRVLVSVEIVEIVGFSAELHALSAISELFHQKRVVLLYDLPNQLPWHCRHFLFLLLPSHLIRTTRDLNSESQQEPSLVVQERVKKKTRVFFLSQFIANKMENPNWTPSNGPGPIPYYYWATTHLYNVTPLLPPPNKFKSAPNQLLKILNCLSLFELKIIFEKENWKFNFILFYKLNLRIKLENQNLIPRK